MASAERWLLHFMKRMFGKITLTLLIVSVIVVLYCLFQNKRTTFAKMIDSENEVLVIGESQDRFDGWKIELCWRRAAGPWMTYLLEGDADFWVDVEISKRTNGFLVKRQHQIVGQLNTVDGRFEYPVQKLVVVRPKDIVKSNDPFDKKSRIYPENPEWNSVWPAAAIAEHSTPTQAPATPIP